MDDRTAAESEAASPENENTIETAEDDAFALAHVEQNGSGGAIITAEELADALPNKDFTLVNVHVPDQGSLPATDYSIPFNDLEAFVATVPDTAASVVIYCRSGGRSSQMVPTLVELG